MSSRSKFGYQKCVWYFPNVNQNWNRNILHNKSGELEEKSETKKKCKRCHLISFCYLNFSKCKASNRNCFECKKTNHFHKSANWKKTKMKKHNMKKKIVSGCLRLRESLKLKQNNHKTELQTSSGNLSRCNKCFKTNMFQNTSFCQWHHSEIVMPLKHGTNQISYFKDWKWKEVRTKG